MLLAACATTPEFSSGDSATIKPMREKHLGCTARNAATLIDGTNDVAFLVKHIASLCDPLLQPIHDYLISRGFSETYARAYVGAIREQHAQINATEILKIKGGTSP